MSDQQSISPLSIGNAIAWIAVILVNGLANALPINGLTTGELSDMYPNLFVPAGFTFSIWGIIYLLLLVFSIHQFTSKGITGRQAIGPWWMINALANISWILAWHYKLVELSLVIMLILLATLFMITSRIEKARETGTKISLVESVPFSIYFGWISVATIANVTTLLVDRGWQGGGISESSWAVIMILVAFTLACAMLFFKRNLAFGAVVAWALFGIYSKQIDGGSDVVAYTAGIGLIALLAFLAVSTVRSWKHYKGVRT